MNYVTIEMPIGDLLELSRLLNELDFWNHGDKERLLRQLAIRNQVDMALAEQYEEVQLYTEQQRESQA